MDIRRVQFAYGNAPQVWYLKRNTILSLWAGKGASRMVQAATPEITRNHCRRWREDLLSRFAEKFGDEFSLEMYTFYSSAGWNWVVSVLLHR